MMHEPFLSAILANQVDDAPRLCYADWLVRQGDPRGEFIRLQVALAGMPEDNLRRQNLRERERELLERHKQEWSGPLGDLAGPVEFRRGFVERVELPAEQFL